MICQKCKQDFPESEVQESHDVPCYLFIGQDRKEKKNQADKFGRHNLCVKCHDIYERMVFAHIVSGFVYSNPDIADIMRQRAVNFGKRWFNGLSS